MENLTDYLGHETIVTNAYGNLTLNNTIYKTLQDYNDEEATRRLIPILYLGLLMLIGIPGNILVLIVYPSKFPKTTYRIFITGLAVADLMVCVITLPFEIIEMRFIYTFYNQWACKFFRTCNGLFALSSIFILMGLSGDRFRRVCRPLKCQITPRYAKIFIISAVTMAILFAWPNFIVSGTRYVNLGTYNITGYDCSLSDKFAKTRYPLIYNGMLFLVFVICMISLIIIYLMIGCKIFKHSQFRRKFSSRSSNKSTSFTMMNSDGSQKRNNDLEDDVFLDKKKGSEKISLSKKSTKKNSKYARNSTKEEKTSRKVTKIAFAISLAFVLSYLPHLTITLLTALKGKFLFPPGPVVSAVLPIVTRSFAINNVVNPIIYGFLDKRFRDSCKLVLKNKICCN